ncbi:MAG: pyrophosphatase PpaX [Myxococcales bacterium]|nr:pyrophosphatase PpaX [Myxococcales bacterium]|tara:strand:+ start:4681 stop:5340 length:660 start_codon:yes stop_codon:yes gene_type:complete
MSIKNIFFDLDGTLLDSIPLIVESMRHALEQEFGYSPDDKTLVSGIGTPLIEQLKIHGAKHLGRPLTQAEVMTSRAVYHNHNLSNHDASIRAFDGVADIISTLQARQIRLGIVTSKPQSTARRGLRICGLEDAFEFVIGFDDVEHPKPHPEPVLKAVSLMDASPDACLFIGDSPHDILSGKRAGCLTAAALWGPFDVAELTLCEPTYLMNSMTDILTLI